MATLAEIETNLRSAITCLSLGTRESERAFHQASADYQIACRRVSVCVNLGCGRHTAAGQDFCSEHGGKFPVTSCDAARAGDRGGCEGDPHAVLVIGRRGEVQRGCVPHAAARISDDYTYWRASPGDVWGADREAYEAAGFIPHKEDS